VEKPADVLRNSNFGNRTAESESRELSSYFVKTSQWKSLLSGNTDVIYGIKGAGKTALYSLLLDSAPELIEKGVLVTAAENPSGAVAFKEAVLVDPPTSETEFRVLWKIYFLCLIAKDFHKELTNSSDGTQVLSILQEAGLLQKSASLSGMLRSVRDYVRGIDLEPTAKIGHSGQLEAVSVKISASQPSKYELSQGKISIDDLLKSANSAMRDEGVTCWILLDRLDVAFEENEIVEGNALRALFRVHLDLLPLAHIRTKIFIRTDIWDRISEPGFREGSHIEKEVRITWTRPNLLNLVVRRLLHNEAIASFYAVKPEEILDNSEEQEKLFDRVFPKQVETGTRKSRTFDWILARTMDGLGNNAPREIIHLLNRLREVQLERLDIGKDTPADGNLFHKNCFKEAFRAVSDTRYQTLRQEYPALQAPLHKLKGQKTEQSIESLSKIWSMSPAEAEAVAEKLTELGFFENRVTHYWVPFLFRDALSMVQGSDRKKRKKTDKAKSELEETT
jgi:hypothetical protein